MIARPEPAGRRGPGRQGFTLVEVLASMVLVAIVLPVAMKGVSMALQIAALARQRSLAVSLAETELSDLITAAPWDQASMKGDFEDYPDYHWTAEVTQWESTTVQQVEVERAVDDARAGTQSVTLDTLVYTSCGAATAGAAPTRGRAAAAQVREAAARAQRLGASGRSSGASGRSSGASGRSSSVGGRGG